MTDLAPAPPIQRLDCRLDIALKSKDEADQLVDNVAGAFRAIGSKLVASAKAAFKGSGGVTSAPPSDDATEPTTKPRSRWQVTGARVHDDGQWRDVPWEEVVNDVQASRMSKLYKILDDFRSFRSPSPDSPARPGLRAVSNLNLRSARKLATEARKQGA